MYVCVCVCVRPTLCVRCCSVRYRAPERQRAFGAGAGGLYEQRFPPPDGEPSQAEIPPPFRNKHVCVYVPRTNASPFLASFDAAHAYRSSSVPVAPSGVVAQAGGRT